MSLSFCVYYFTISCIPLSVLRINRFTFLFIFFFAFQIGQNFRRNLKYQYQCKKNLEKENITILLKFFILIGIKLIFYYQREKKKRKNTNKSFLKKMI